MDRALDAEPVSDSIAVGALLGGRYRLSARIAAGGMATIFSARDESLERQVAVKVLHAHLADDPAVLARFRTEARHAAGLTHPHIVNVYDQGVADLPYIVMEQVDGPSLREVLVERTRLSPGEALSVIAPICAALSKAHAAGVVHRDVKPENVLIDPDGAPKVVDFGIARALAATSHTQTGTLVGSVHYMAPELVDGGEPSPASDQYAVGVVLFELLTGRKPLEAQTPMAVALRHAREQIPRPSEFAGDTPEAVDEVVARATAMTPDERYPDLAALADALRAAVSEGPTPVVVSQPGDGADRTLIIPAIPAVSKDTVSLSPPSGSARTRPASERRRRSSAPRQRSRLRRALIAALVSVVALAALAGGGYALWDQVIAPEIAVPPLAGLSESQAFDTLTQMDLGLVIADSANSRDVEVGHILSQQPEPDALLRRGGVVEVVTSAGPAEVEMPDVRQMDLAKATEALEGEPYFFQVVVHEGYHDTVPKGIVRLQNPEPGTALRQDAEVIVQISAGIEPVEVPALTGMNQEQAEAALEEAKLVGEFTAEYSDEHPEEGLVFSQDREPGEILDKGSTIGVVISRGPLTFEMPNVRGKKIEDATSQLEAMDLVVAVQGVPRPAFGPFRRGELGRVEEQLPQPGQAINRGDSVTLYTHVDED